jgi:hypothetical protein
VPAGVTGAPTIIRCVSSQLQRFLIDLASADGSDDPCFELGFGSSGR